MIAKCTKCALTYDSAGYNFRDVQNVVLDENLDRCPRCGGMAVVLPGTFDVDVNGMAILLSGPQFTKDVLTELASLTDHALKGKIKLDEFKKEVEGLGIKNSFIQNFEPKSPADYSSYLNNLLTAISIVISLMDKPAEPTGIYQPTTTFNQPVDYSQNTVNNNTINYSPTIIIDNDTVDVSAEELRSPFTEKEAKLVKLKMEDHKNRRLSKEFKRKTKS